MTTEQKILRRCKRRVTSVLREALNLPSFKAKTTSFRRIDADHFVVSVLGLEEGELFPKEQILRRAGMLWDLSVSPPVNKY